MKKNIAIVTDASLFCNIFVPLLKNQNADVEVNVCSNYYDIDKRITTRSCDLILVDGGMTQMSCLEVIQYLRMNKLVLVPIWFFPEIQTKEYFMKSLALGVSKIVHKPFDPLKISKEIAV
jgi:DNA-binding response OmpR family regulator